MRPPLKLMIESELGDLYIDTARKFVDLALRDLEAGKLLFEKEYYPQAIYLIHQAAEKSLKGLMLYIGLIDIEDLPRIGHKPAVKLLEHVIPFFEDLIKYIENETGKIEGWEDLRKQLKEVLNEARNILIHANKLNRIIFQEWEYICAMLLVPLPAPASLLEHHLAYLDGVKKPMFTFIGILNKLLDVVTKLYDNVTVERSSQADKLQLPQLIKLCKLAASVVEVVVVLSLICSLAYICLNFEPFLKYLRYPGIIWSPEYIRSKTYLTVLAQTYKEILENSVNIVARLVRSGNRDTPIQRLEFVIKIFREFFKSYSQVRGIDISFI